MHCAGVEVAATGQDGWHCLRSEMWETGRLKTVLLLEERSLAPARPYCQSFSPDHKLYFYFFYLSVVRSGVIVRGMTS